MGTISSFNYQGKASEIFRIWIINILLGILTLGVYRFWGKTRIRRYIASSLSINGHYFEYTGTGKELFIGFLKALLILSPVLAAFLYCAYFDYKKINYFIFFILFPIPFAASYSAMRYRASRTNWCGIRFSLKGSAFKFAILCVTRWFVEVATLFIFTPYFDLKLHGYYVKNLHVGKTKIEFNGNPSKIFLVHIITLILAPFTLGISRFWYRAALYRYMDQSTKVGSITLLGKDTALKLLKLYGGNLFFMIITLGFGVAFIIHRNIKYMADNLKIVGDLSNLIIEQSDEKLNKAGEGLDTIMNDDSDFLSF